MNSSASIIAASILLLGALIPKSSYSAIYKNSVAHITAISQSSTGVKYTMLRLGANQGISGFQVSGGKYTFDLNPTLFFDTFYNSAPQWQDNITIPMDWLDEDAELNSGESVVYLLSKTTPWRDADRRATKGIAIINSNTRHGRMQYSMDFGLNWHEINGVDEHNALLLDAQEYTRIRFVADANYSGSDTGSIEIKAWDRTEGHSGTFFNIQKQGAYSAFSEATATIRSPNIISRDDAPSIFSLPDQVLRENSTRVNFEIPVNDIDTPLSNLFVSCFSNNDDLIDTSAMKCWLEGGRIILQIEPILGETGDAKIFVKVGDGNSNAVTAFNVNVIPEKNNASLQVYDSKNSIVNETVVLADAENEFTIVGGAGDYELEVVSQPDGGNISFQMEDSHRFRILINRKGAFAGDYKVAIHDKLRGVSKNITFHMPLSIETRRSSYLANQRGIITIRGGEPGEIFMLDIARLEQGRESPLVINMQATAVAELNEQYGNPVHIPFTVSVLSGFVDFRVKARRAVRFSPLSDSSKAIHAVPTQKYCGMIYDQIKKIPVGGAEVLVNSKVVATAKADGTFKFNYPRLALGEYDFVFRAMGYEPKRISATAFRDDACASNVSLMQGDMVFRGLLSGLTNGEKLTIYVYYDEDGKKGRVGPYFLNVNNGNKKFELSVISNRKYESIVFFSEGHAAKTVDIANEEIIPKAEYVFGSKIEFDQSYSYELGPMKEKKEYPGGLFLSGGKGDLCNAVFMMVNEKNSQQTNVDRCVDGGIGFDSSLLSFYQLFLWGDEGGINYAGRYDSRIQNPGTPFFIEEKNLEHVSDVVLDFNGQASNDSIHLEGEALPFSARGVSRDFYEMVTKAYYLENVPKAQVAYDLNVYRTTNDAVPQLEKIDTKDYASLQLSMKIDLDAVSQNDFKNGNASIVESEDVFSLENGIKENLPPGKIEYFDMYNGRIRLDVRGDSAFSIHTNAPPMAFDVTARMNKNGICSSRLVGIDDGKNVTFGIVKGKGPAVGAIYLNEHSGEFVYKADMRRAGADSFQYYVHDGEKYSEFATVYLAFDSSAAEGRPARRRSGGALSIFILFVFSRVASSRLFFRWLLGRTG